MMEKPAYRVRFGARLKALRTARAQTQAQVADRLGFKQPTIRKYEAGTNMPGPDVLAALARIWTLTPRDLHWLLTGDDTPEEP